MKCNDIFTSSNEAVVFLLELRKWFLLFLESHNSSFFLVLFKADGISLSWEQSSLFLDCLLNWEAKYA
jgi:hypothetical protein